MFDVGFGEMFMIAIVALLVLGPERLPKAARFAGLWVRRARAQWHSIKAELENELADEELTRSLQQTRAELQEARDSLARSGTALQRQLEETHADVRDALRTDAPRTDAAGDARDVSDADIEPPLPSVTDADAQPQLPLDDRDHEPAAVNESTSATEPRPDARR